MRVFNRLMDSIRQAAQQERFSHPPIGPLGSCLRLNDDKWALAAEVILNKHLGAFVVHNTKDQRLLRVSRNAQDPAVGWRDVL